MDIEMFVSFHDGTWDTMWIKIPEGDLKGINLEPDIKRLSRDQVMNEFGDLGIAFFGILPEFEPELEDEEDEEGCAIKWVEDNEFDDEYEEEEEDGEISLIAILIMVLLIAMVLYATNGALK
jgi:hypothetical protein